MQLSAIHQKTQLTIFSFGVPLHAKINVHNISKSGVYTTRNKELTSKISVHFLDIPLIVSAKLII